jgi:cytochrome c-type biogenesis protein CcmH/NrfG
MKKEEMVEVKYIKLNTALLIGFIALVVGFLGGNVYSVYKGGPAVSRAALSQPAGGNPAAAAQAARITALENEVKINPENKLAWVELGNLYFDADLTDGAIRAYNAFLKLEPGNANVWTDLGVMYRRSRQEVKALGAFEQAIRLDPRHEQSRFNKGVVLFYDMKDNAAARKAWEELTAINPLFRTPSGKPLQDLIEETK